jgi:hypothetical protein
MSTRLLPEVGLWYAHRDKGQLFQVVAIDERERLVEIQNFDGDVDEIDFDGWHAMPLDLTDQPEDWSGPVDDADADDLGDGTESDLPARDWRSPVDDLPALPQEAIEADDDTDERRLR